ncbi:MAG: hypothetical protein IPL46_20215 [Saprospiraceae bacterium]|nr:hypothetical protein [Saprospiraceae bacterium]
MKVSLLPLLCLLIGYTTISTGQITSINLKYNDAFSDEMTVYIKVRNPSTFRADRAMASATPRFKRTTDYSRQKLDFSNSSTYALVFNQLNNFDLVETDDDINISWKSNFNDLIARLELVKYAESNAAQPEMVQTIHNVDAGSRVSFRVSEFNNTQPGLYQIKVYDEAGHFITSTPRPYKPKTTDLVSIYPKETPDEVMISQIPVNTKTIIKVIDDLNRECLTKIVDTDQTFINLSNLKAGNYKISIQSGTFRFEESIVKI